MVPLLLLACSSGASATPAATPPSKDSSPAPVPAVGPGQAAAVFAGGCFWCMESDFDKLPGIVATTSGYAGGHLKNPTYGDVTSETTGHAEAVRVVYDTSKLSYEQVLDYYWHHVDPTDDGGQFCDRGDSYRSEVYYADDAQKATAEASKAKLDAAGALPGPIKTRVVALEAFWPAEVYHQDFHVTNPGRYEPYRWGCGRDARVKLVWSGS